MVKAVFLAIAMLLIIAPIAQAQYDDQEEPPSDPCFDLSYEWDDCYGGTSGGSAPGMNSCTSTVGCQKCVVPEGQLKESCATEKYANGYCKCGYNAQGGCTASGACTYVR